ncbi:hypothetical protein [Pseudoalteromonas arctica]|uniref:Uncharacterized protein n=1 Tax=Pseudoalteromonas arctica TaxID=394751 RepID=A0A7Y0DSP0_9GAMM|nr:hypothetical protein [Pseudoalteromonas arctica]NMM40952.1 hypothetical protein [Pseudoalteromonas arctica]
MEYKEITAEQARKNSEHSTYGTKEALKSIFDSINANSNAGAKSITTMLSKQSINDNELTGVISELELKGFEVDLKDKATVYTLTIKW